MEKNHYFYELFGFFLIALGGFFLLSLMSYCPGDYPEDIFPVHNQIHNICGSLGTTFSRAIFWWIGQGAAFFFSLFLLLWGGYIFLKEWNELSLASVALLTVTISIADAEFSLFQIYSTLPPGGKYGICVDAFLKTNFPFWARYCMILALFGLSMHLLIRSWKAFHLIERDEEDCDPLSSSDSGVHRSPILLLQGRSSGLSHPLLLQEVVAHNPSHPFLLPLGQKKEDQKGISLSLAQKKGLLVAGSCHREVLHFLQTLLTSLLFHHSAEDLQMLFVDRRGSLSDLEGIPHLLPFSFSGNLGEMLAMVEEEVEKRRTTVPQEGEKRPLILLVIEELGEVMLSAPKEAESLFKKLSEGEHLGIFTLIGTGRPSLDVITPGVARLCESRLALPVSSKIESSLLLGREGAEQLPPRGEALYVSALKAAPVALSLPYVSSQELKKVAACFSSATLNVA